MSKLNNTLGTSRHLTPRYADLKKTCLQPIKKHSSLNDSRSSLNENGKTS